MVKRLIACAELAEAHLEALQRRGSGRLQAGPRWSPVEGGPGGSCSDLKERLEAAAEDCEDHGKRGLWRIGPCAWSPGSRWGHDP